MLSASVSRASCLARPFIRSISVSARSFNDIVGARPSPKQNAVKDPKVLAKRVQRKKAEHKLPPQENRLYMNIPTAMKYLRAAEVGQPAKKTTVSLQIRILPERGSIPLQGKVFLPRSVKSNTAIVFTSNPEVQEQIKEFDSNIVVGGADLIERVQLGLLDLSSFTQGYATPEIVALLKPISRTLGVKNLMPTVRKGSVADNIVEIMENDFGAQPFKQKGELLSIPVGRCDFSDEEIIRNIHATSKAVHALQPAGTKKPNLIGRCHIGSTQGPSMVIDFRN